MLVQIGPPKEPSDIVDLLLECHERIRAFIGLALRLAKSEKSEAGQISDAAARVRRYFSEALPLHVADEEESILPRLSGRDVRLDAAVQKMQREHREHEADLKTLLETCKTLETSPGKLDELRDTLLKAASRLETSFIEHLEEEERVILPAIRSELTAEEQALMLTELRNRRG